MPSYIQIEGCTACGFGPTMGIKDHQGYESSGFPKVDLCRVCYESHTGAVLYTRSDPTLRTLLRAVAYATNMVLQRLDQLDKRPQRAARGLPDHDDCVECGAACFTFVPEVNGFLHPECAPAFRGRK